MAAADVPLRRKTWTSLVGELDSETLQQVMSRFFAAMRAAIERHGGTVEKYAGDAVMGAFGVPTVREDDARRAVRTAIEMRTELAALNHALQHDHGAHLSIGVGVNTGEVVARDASSRPSFVTGPRSSWRGAWAV